MNKLIMMVGLAGSGKSTEAMRIAEKESAVIHSSDDLREEMFGSAEVQDQNSKLFAELHKRIKADLAFGKNVIYDACNIDYKRRMAFLQEIKQFDCIKKVVVMATPYEDCLKQNQLRERKVPDHVIKRMYLNFYIPQTYEGWDEITIQYNASHNLSILTRLHQLYKISQDNSHHKYSIGEHCDKCGDNILKLTNDRNLYVAGMLHDIGKAFTKTFKNAKGEPTIEAHFYQHHLVSAYEAMFYLQNKPFSNVLEILALITWHMRPFDLITEKAQQKFINLVGQDFYNKLMILHEADKKAC